MKYLGFLLFFLSGFSHAEKAQCAKFFIDLPDYFVSELMPMINHFPTKYCAYKVNAAEQIGDDSNVSISVDLSLHSKEIEFTATQSETIALYHAQLTRSSFDNLHEKNKLNFIGPLPEIISDHKFFCTLGSFGTENIITEKRCFTFDQGTLLNVSFTHHSEGTVDISELETILQSFDFAY